MKFPRLELDCKMPTFGWPLRAMGIEDHLAMLPKMCLVFWQTAAEEEEEDARDARWRQKSTYLNLEMKIGGRLMDAERYGRPTEEG